MKSIRTHQRRIAVLKQIIVECQWVHPTYNGSDSCACCGSQRHLGCPPECKMAAITGDYGTRDKENTDDER